MPLTKTSNRNKKIIKIVLISLGITTCIFFDAGAQSFRLTKSDNKEYRLGQTYDKDLPLRVEFELGQNIKLDKGFGLLNGGVRQFIAPTNAIYHFDVQMNFSYPLTDDTTTDETRSKFSRWYLNLYKNSEIIESSVLTNNEHSTLSQRHSLAISTTVMLRKGDAISMGFIFDASPGEYVIPDFISFSGFKVSDFLVRMAPIQPSTK